MKNKNAYTLMEIVVVIVLIGLVAAFGLPKYTKAIRRGHERDMINQLVALHAMNYVYQARNGHFYQGTNENLSQVNSALGMKLNLTGKVLNYSSPLAYTSQFEAIATYYEGDDPPPPFGAEVFSVVVKAGSIFISGGNPCCFFGPCPTLPSCILNYTCGDGYCSNPFEGCGYPGECPADCWVC